MFKLTFYGGAGTIGGNKILLEDKDAKIYLDFGQDFDFGEQYFYQWLQPRTANGLEVYFQFDLLPKVEKLYNREDLRFTDIKYQKSDVDAILISHSHSDHVGHLRFVDESIPIYMGHFTDRLIETYTDRYGNLTSIGEHKDIRTFRSGEKIKIKHLMIKPIHVEHSVPGAYGFIIHTSKGPIVYTGDLRLHGPRSDMTQEFIKKAKACKPYALLCEGTRMERGVEHNFSEQEVELKVDQELKNAKGLVFANFSMSNIDRFMSFYRSAIKNKRKMVIDTRFAYILDSLKDELRGLPDPKTDKNIRVYYRLARYRKDDSIGFEKMAYPPWEREYYHKKVTYKDMAKNGRKYVMHLGFYRLMELVYIKPKNAKYIYSQSEHFLEGDENEQQLRVMENWLQKFNIEFLRKEFHCSGHACKRDIIKMVRQIEPEILIPIHTTVPHEFEKLHDNVMIPKRGDVLRI